VVLNGVMIGLSRQEAQRRLDAVFEFAELRDFVDLKLKNYSSGMMVRLAFSVMIQSDADVLLIDEVLAVGDAAFQQKCADVFHEMRDAGRTVVLVTHDMASVQRYCHRAMLLHDGELRFIGDPEEVAKRYYRLNFAGWDGDRRSPSAAVPDVHARVVDAWLEDEGGERITNVEHGTPIRFGIVFEAIQELEQPVFGFHCANANGVHVFGFNRSLEVDEGEPDRVEAGRRVRISGTIENRLAPGRYVISCLISRRRAPGDAALQLVKPLDFVVFGSAQPGLVSVPVEAEAVAETEEEL
jgi:hypothetical protein